MKNSILLFLTFIISNSAFSQLAIINDKDGYVNIRKSNSPKSEIMGSVSDGAIFYISDPSDGINGKLTWWYATYYDNLDNYNRNITRGENAHYYQGYIHISRFLYIYDLPTVPSQYYHRKYSTKIINYNKKKYPHVQCDTIGVRNEKINFKIIAGSFKKEDHLIVKDKYGNIKTIDEHRCNGIENNLPEREIKRMSLTINGQKVSFPKQLYNDLYEINLCKLKLHYDFKGRLYIDMSHNSDGCGSFDVAWVIDKNYVVKRYIGSL
jgi:hypothetical protein